jgi:lysozyme family protein
MILAMNGADFFGDFGELGAASKAQAIANLQSALVALGKGIKDGVLMKVAIDGLIGPKTVAATNRAMTVHLGVGQAPANLRTGSLSQQEVVSQADTLTNLIETEARRRGFTVPTAKSVSTVETASKPKATTAVAPAASYATPTAAYAPPTAVTAASPVYRVPASAAPVKGMDMAAIMKWSAIGVGAVVLAGAVYYLTTKPKTAFSGFAAAEDGRGRSFKLRWFPANSAYGVVWGDQHIDIRGRHFFPNKAEARAALKAAGLKLVGKNTVVSENDGA